MDLKEILKNQGLTDEQADAVLGEMKLCGAKHQSMRKKLSFDMGDRPVGGLFFGLKFATWGNAVGEVQFAVARAKNGAWFAESHVKS